MIHRLWAFETEEKCLFEEVLVWLGDFAANFSMSGRLRARLAFESRLARLFCKMNCRTFFDGHLF